ncbi:MAG TPA: hypothetical protein PLK80_03300 [bacterium]|nr:MAG: hypothetical protein BWY28_02154 [bacterium ADurb.Bin236]HOY61647.1 hypothetical protein [bacterium]HPI75733.1 hypothetical protein [bacterium]HPN95050.1 hypothetical protein [bacterium]
MSGGRQIELFDDLNSEERRVYEALLGRPTPADAIGMRELAAECRLSERELRGVVLHLRFAHNIPVASSSRAGGYWLPCSAASAKPHIDEFTARAYTAALNLAVGKRTNLRGALQGLIADFEQMSGEDLRGLLPQGVKKELIESK